MEQTVESMEKARLEMLSVQEYCGVCGSLKLEIDCEECTARACEGHYGNCCNCGVDYVTSFID